MSRQPGQSFEPADRTGLAVPQTDAQQNKSPNRTELEQNEMGFQIALLKKAHLVLKGYYSFGYGGKPDDETPGHKALRKLVAQTVNPKPTLKDWRDGMDIGIFDSNKDYSGTKFDTLEDTAAPVPILRISPDTSEAKKEVVVYFHGGGYVAGSPEDYNSSLARISRETGMVVYAPDYRVVGGESATSLADLKNDVVDSLLYLVQEKGVSVSDIILVGDSAGGGIVYYLLHYIQAHMDLFGDSVRKAVLISPYINIGVMTDRTQPVEMDPMVTMAALELFKEVTMCENSIIDDLNVSSMKSNSFTTECYISASKQENLHPDSQIASKGLKDLDFNVIDDIAEFGLHDYPLLWDFDKSYDEAFRRVVKFIN